MATERDHVELVAYVYDYRFGPDPIAACGELAIEPMTDWVGDPRLAAFAIRVLERIGREPKDRSAVITVLTEVDRTELAPPLIGDLDRALMALGASTVQARAKRRADRSSRRIATPSLPRVA